MCRADKDGEAHFHLVVQPIVKYEVVSHAYAVRLHGVPRAIVVAAQLWVIEVCNL